MVASIQKVATAQKDKGLKAFVVFTGGPELKPTIEKVARDNKITIPLTFLPRGTGADDFQRYRINPEAKNTVVVYKGKRVVTNLVDVDAKTFPQVEKAVTEVLGQ